MKILDLALNGIIALSVVVFFAYVGFIYFDFGLFTTLPANISGFFLAHGAVQYIALGVGIAALVAKLLVGRAIKRLKAEERTRNAR